jgi:predicted RNA-binding Zn ribbon-like protein
LPDATTRATAYVGAVLLVPVEQLGDDVCDGMHGSHLLWRRCDVSDTSQDVIPVSTLDATGETVMLVSRAAPTRGGTMATVDLPRPDVPAPIAVVRDFVNTTDYETGTDELTTPAELSQYLVREGLLERTEPADDDDLALARRLRSGLRRALELNHDGAEEALPALAETLADLPVALAWDGAGTGLRAGGTGVRGALARIGLAAHEATSEGIWWRLKICASDECEWAYYDHSKNRSRNWCEYGCGNKIKTRAYRARKAAGR